MKAMSEVIFEIDKDWIKEIRTTNGRVQTVYDSPTPESFLLRGVLCTEKKSRRDRSINCDRNDAGKNYTCINLPYDRDFSCKQEDGKKLKSSLIRTPFRPEF